MDLFREAPSQPVATTRTCIPNVGLYLCVKQQVYIKRVLTREVNSGSVGLVCGTETGEDQQVDEETLHKHSSPVTQHPGVWLPDIHLTSLF